MVNRIKTLTKVEVKAPSINLEILSCEKISIVFVPLARQLALACNSTFLLASVAAAIVNKVLKELCLFIVLSKGTVCVRLARDCTWPNTEVP